MTGQSGLREKILELLKRPEHASLTLRHMLVVLDLPRDLKPDLKDELIAMRREGLVLREGSHWRIANRPPATIEGTISITRDGYGFVRSPVPGKPDVFVPAARTRGAMNGDLVEVHLRVDKFGRQVGEVGTILERKIQSLVGRYQTVRGEGQVTPWDRKLSFAVLVEHVDTKLRPKSGDLVEIEILDYPTRSHTEPTGRIVDLLGSEKDPSVDLDVAKRIFNFPQEFPKKVLEEADRMVKWSFDLKGREDLRNEEIFTIDGADAKDFDDAVSIVERPGGGFRLWVHVADVSHYVTEGSALDEEARERGNSIYFPDRVVPMLPHQLSDDLNSLVPGKDRLTLTAEMDFTKDGVREKYRIFPSVIHSKARLIYGEVEDFLKTGAKSASVAKVAGSLEKMGRLAAMLNRIRIQRGSLDFQMPERYVVLDDEGHVIDIKSLGDPKARNLIEEFMLAANEAVAEFLKEREIPMVYRVHDTPSDRRLTELAKVLSDLNLKIPMAKLKSSEGLQEILTELDKREGADSLKMLVLRSLTQAKYQEGSALHFGLASRLYTHFTSPIRRYPDLLVHRVTKDTIGFDKLPPKKREQLMKSLEERAEHSSKTERRAMEAERLVKKMKMARLMSQYLGETFDGIVTGVSAFGVFVTLSRPAVDGLIPLAELPPDRYRMVREGLELLGERSGHRFTLGQDVTVQVVEVDILRGEITLGLRTQGMVDSRMPRQLGERDGQRRRDEFDETLKQSREKKKAKRRHPDDEPAPRRQSVRKVKRKKEEDEERDHSEKRRITIRTPKPRNVPAKKKAPSRGSSREESGSTGPKPLGSYRAGKWGGSGARRGGGGSGSGGNSGGEGGAGGYPRGRLKR